MLKLKRTIDPTSQWNRIPIGMNGTSSATRVDRLPLHSEYYLKWFFQAASSTQRPYVLVPEAWHAPIHYKTLANLVDRQATTS